VDAASRAAEELRETWQARALVAAEDKMFAVVLSILAHNFDDEMPTLLRTVFPDFVSIHAPFLCTAGRIQKDGSITAGLVTRDGVIVKDFHLYRDELEMVADLRRLADELKLDDGDRRHMFACARRWVVCDYRLDPTMDPLDPDAKRLVH
jgi:hypothetical protein